MHQQQMTDNFGRGSRGTFVNKIFLLFYIFGFRFLANAFLIRSVRSGLSGGTPSKRRFGLTSNAWLNFEKVTMEAGNFPFSM